MNNPRKYPMHGVLLVCFIAFLAMCIGRFTGLMTLSWVWVTAPLWGFAIVGMILGIFFVLKVEPTYRR